MSYASDSLGNLANGDHRIATKRLQQRIPSIAANRQFVDEAVEESLRNTDSREYLHLRRLVAEKGLLDRQYLYYGIKIPGMLVALGLGIAVVVAFEQLWVQMLNAVFLAVVFGQFGFIGHDSGHRQIFHSAFRNDMVMMLAGLVTGMTPSWWQDKHNAHHRNPNQLDLDGDIEVSVFAFTEEQAMKSRGILRIFVKYQAFFFYPILLLSSLSFLGGGVAYLLRRERVRYPIAEVTVVVAGICIYLGILFAFLPAWQAVVFIVVHRALAGLYMGSVFAPNHKGMPVLEPDTKLDYMRQQVLTSRDVIPNPVIDFAYGGLNYQIEHHLFPNMPCNRLRGAREVVKAFCGTMPSPITRRVSGGRTMRSSATCTRSARPCAEGARQPADAEPRHRGSGRAGRPYWKVRLLLLHEAPVDLLLLLLLRQRSRVKPGILNYSVELF